MRPVRWRRVRSSDDGLPFEPVVVTQAGRGKLAGAKEPSQWRRRVSSLRGKNDQVGLHEMISTALFGFDSTYSLMGRRVR